MTSKLTREERVQALYDLKVGQVLSQADIENVKMLSRMALAAMDSEPVAWTWHYREQWHVTNDKCRAEFVATDGDVAVLPLYRHAQPAPAVPGKWIPVSEQMPEVGVKVLCFPVKDEPIHATFNGQLWLQDISWSVSDEPIDNVITASVTHWMPLPAAPQEVKP
ncbi:TPA: DUF551 domain-containing protein [Klebsiella quasipneumoniae subsp. similipneumoniae]|nr:DUF551 domain-containing protein [Klebsiella quasipneumoniae subsp. similipneumoniae]